MLHKHPIFPQTIIPQIIHQASLIISHLDYKSKGEINSVRETICTKIATMGVYIPQDGGDVGAFLFCISNATLLPKWALHTYDEIYGVSSFESTCALLKFSSDQRVGSSPDIPNS